MSATLSANAALVRPGTKEHGVPGQYEPPKGGRRKSNRAPKNTAPPRPKIAVPGMNKAGVISKSIHASAKPKHECNESCMTEDGLHPTGKFRRKYGIPPRGAGPHAPSSYGYPLPPPGHPKAIQYAHAVLSRADQSTNFDRAGVQAQVHKAQAILKKADPNYRPTKESLKIENAFVVKMREAGPNGPQVRSVIIVAGPGNPVDRHYYTNECLKDAVERGVFEGKQCYIDHPTELEDRLIPERKVEKMAGYFKNCVLAEDGNLARIEADFVPEVGNAEVMSKILTAMRYAQDFPDKSYVGLSINAAGSTDSDNPIDLGGKQYFPVTRIDEATSVDIVTRAGAGGRFITLSESWKMAEESVAPSQGDKFTMTPDEKTAFLESIRETVEKTVTDKLKKLREDADTEDGDTEDGDALEADADVEDDDAEAKPADKPAAKKSDPSKKASKAIKAYHKFRQDLQDAGVNVTPELDKQLDALLGIPEGSLLDAAMDREDEAAVGNTHPEPKAQLGGDEVVVSQDGADATGSQPIDDKQHNVEDDEVEDDADVEDDDVEDDVEEDDDLEDDDMEDDVSEDVIDGGENKKSDAYGAAGADEEEESNAAKQPGPAGRGNLVLGDAKSGNGAGSLVKGFAKSGDGTAELSDREEERKAHKDRDLDVEADADTEDDADVESMSVEESRVALKKARAALRAKAKEAKALERDVHEALKTKKMIETLEHFDVPKAHRPRLMRELGRLGRDEDYQEHVAEFVQRNLGSANGAGVVARENLTATGSREFEVKCFEYPEDIED